MPELLHSIPLTGHLSYCLLLLLLLSRFSCVQLCDPIDGSPSGSPVPGILQARVLEGVAISFSNAWKWKVKVKSLSCVRLFVTPRTAAFQAPPSMGFSRQEYWSGVPLPSLIFTPAAAAAKLLQSCPTLCDPIDRSPPGSPVPGILQARTLEWVAISFSNAGKWRVKGKSLSRVRLLATPWTAAYQAPLSMGFSRQEYWLEWGAIAFSDLYPYIFLKPWKKLAVMNYIHYPKGPRDFFGLCSFVHPVCISWNSCFLPLICWIFVLP